jgi:hypothetical protein
MREAFKDSAGLLVVVAALFALLLLGVYLGQPPWEACDANHPLACSTLGDAKLGYHIRSAPARTAPCGPCRDTIGTAVAALKKDWPNHPPLASIDEFEHDQRDLCPSGACTYSSAPPTIIVFGFTDGTNLPIEVGCPGVGPSCVVFGFDGRLA